MSGAPDAHPMPKALGLMANHLRIGEAWLSFSTVLAKETALEVRLFELIVLRVAWRTRSAYEWAQHTRMGQQAGLTVEQVYAIPQGAEAEVWTPVERSLLAATDQMIDRHAVDDATWALLAEHFDEPQLLEILFVAGAYICLAIVCNSVGLRPDPPTEPIDAPALPGPED